MVFVVEDVCKEDGFHAHGENAYEHSRESVPKQEEHEQDEERRIELIHGLTSERCSRGVGDQELDQARASAGDHDGAQQPEEAACDGREEHLVPLLDYLLDGATDRGPEVSASDGYDDLGLAVDPTDALLHAGHTTLGAPDLALYHRIGAAQLLYLLTLRLQHNTQGLDHSHEERTHGHTAEVFLDGDLHGVTDVVRLAFLLLFFLGGSALDAVLRSELPQRNGCGHDHLLCRHSEGDAPEKHEELKHAHFLQERV